MEKATPFCPWGFLNLEVPQTQSLTVTVPEKEVVTDVRPSKSYAAVLKPKYGRNIDTSLLPIPGRQGEFPTISLIEEEVDKGIKFCSQSLVGRLDMNKVDLDRIRTLVRLHWKPVGFVQVTPLGRGHVMFRFDKAEDFQKIWDQGSWIFDKQILRLVKWTPNFSTEKETQSHAAVWVRFPGLSLEYWEVRNLLALGKAIGRPIHVDETTAKRELGYYASVYVDLDLSKPVPDKIWVESKKHGVGFWQTVKLGKTPEFCNHCKGVGHSVARCKFLKSDLERDKAANAHKEKSPVVQNVDKEALTSNVVVDVDLSIMSKNQRKRWRRKNTNGASSSGSKENGVALGISTENAENFKVVPSENQADKQGESEENAIQIETEGGTSMVVAEAILTEQVMDGQNKFLPSKELVVETSVEILPCIDVVEAIGHGSEQGACEISPEGILEIVLQGPTEASQVEISQVQGNVHSEPTGPTACTRVQGVEPDGDAGVHTIKAVEYQIVPTVDANMIIIPAAPLDVRNNFEAIAMVEEDNESSQSQEFLQAAWKGLTMNPNTGENSIGKKKQKSKGHKNPPGPPLQTRCQNQV